MARRSISLKVILAGLVVGVLLSSIGIMVPQVPDQVLLGGFALVLILASASLASSARAGLVFALFALLSENVVDFIYIIYFASTYRPDISLVPYALGFVLFVGRIPLFPFAGTLGGYMGKELFGEPVTKGKRLREKSRKRQAQTHKL